MATKDIGDELVCKAYKAYNDNRATKGPDVVHYPYDYMMVWTGQCQKVCMAAMERAVKRRLVDFGVSIRTGFLTDKGKALLVEYPTTQKV